MPFFKLRYISGPQSKLTLSEDTTMQAASLDQALAAKSEWPVERDFRGKYAWAKNPGTSLYYVEAWEAELVAD